MPELHELRIFTGTAHPELAMEIAKILDVPLSKCSTNLLPDSEIHVMIDEVVRGQDVFFIQPCSVPVNDNLMEVFLFLDAFKRASANCVSLVMPYFPYARQDRMARGRESVSAKVVAYILERMNTRRVIFVDIHNLAIQGFFNIPVDPLSAVPLLADYFKKPEFENAAIVSPDVGRTSMAGKYAQRLNLPLVVMHKRRSSFTETETTHVVGDIKGRRPIVIDDLVAGGSVLKQIDALYEAGAEGKTCFSITHPVLLPSALEYLDYDERIEKLIVTNTIPVPLEKQHPKLEIISIAGLLAETIKRIHCGQSISPLLVLS
ncbi:MAG: ribose-phosphate diphosphokinase [Anaerolineales bacterium]|nr:ribose-phosphate diphosphokinase [Anaerolineales bacterium]